MEWLLSEVFYRPVYNLVVFVYNFTPGPNLGWTIIGLAVFIRLIFLYFTLRGYQTDKVYNQLEPIVHQIEKDNSLTSAGRRAEIIKLLKKHDINPYSEIVGVFAQFLFLLILYFVLQVGIKPEGFKDIYPFITHPVSINTVFFGYDLSKSDFPLSFIASVALFIELFWESSTKPAIAKVKFSERWYPLLLSSLTFVLLYILPSAKAVFIFTSVVFSLAIKALVVAAQSSNSSSNSHAPSHDH